MAEVIKAAIILDKSFFDELLNEQLDFRNMIEKSISIKNNLILNDPKEKNVRKYLNFGHTIGHGIEFSHQMLHGYAVGQGMVLESLYAV